MPITRNTLFYGDNLQILRHHIADESVDLIYLDPPFNSNRSYNVLFKDESGQDSESQMVAFEDTWHWNHLTETTYSEIITTGATGISAILSSLRQAIGANQMMAYIVMMAARMMELHRVLKPTGSIYLHCDPTASHYIKIIMDAVFSPENFKNEIVWKRASAHNDPRKYGNIHDTIFFYTKTDEYTWNHQYTPYTKEYLDAEWNTLSDGRMYKTENMLDPQGKMEEYDFKGTLARWRTNHAGMMEFWNAPDTGVPSSHGRIKIGKNGCPTKRCRIIFLEDMKGVPLQTWWGDILSLRGGAAERLGYPTQKPVSLLERIISASSNPGDTVLDPFGGCGTSIAAAQRLGRKWIGIDITNLSIALQKYRLKDAFGLVEKVDYDVIGEPTDLSSAHQLAQDDRYQFQWWALSLIQSRPLGGTGGKEGKKGSDKGIDGIISFIDEQGGKAKQVLVQVKSGKVKSGDIRDLKGTIEREKAAMGVFITLEDITKDMKTEAATAGNYRSPGYNKDYPKIQLFTISELLHGSEVKMPQTITFKQAPVSDKNRKQGKLF